MFKLFVTLLKGKILESETALSTRNALPVLNVQIREAAQDVEMARKAVAVSMAQLKQETEAANALEMRLSDLEARAVAALQCGQESLAREAAETIALMENELSASRKALAESGPVVNELKQRVRQAEMRLVALQRGNRLAIARESTQRLASHVPGAGSRKLQAAEETLEALNIRQRGDVLAAEAYDAISLSRKPQITLEKLASAGCGDPLSTSPDAVLKRLAARAAEINA